jgi:transposase
MRADQAYPARSEEVVFAVSLELAASKWKVVLHDGRCDQPALHTVAKPQAAAGLPFRRCWT